MRVLKWLAIGLGGSAAVLWGGFLYAKPLAEARFAQRFEVPAKQIPIPFPLTDQELDALRAELPPAGGEVTAAGTAAAVTAALDAEGTTTGSDALDVVDVEAIALERAVARGKRYLETRAGCTECHGDDLGGKVVIDSPVMGKWVAPNITRGGLTRGYTAQDWVRIIRHGIKSDGTAATMPSQDFTWFSDQEISDIAAYIQSVPAVDRVMPPTEFGPVFTMLVLTGEFAINAETLDHETERPVFPPRLEPNEQLGKHLATTCVGCHGGGLSGGPIVGGDPSWPPARNLTFHETGLAGWSLDDFRTALREGVRPDGSAIDPVMPIAFTARYMDAEIEALYVYLKTLTPTPFGQH